ncbi:MAG: hypothetical protein ACFFEY_06800 [Candidatus Thorarchaeota archaeon]
MNYKVMKTGFNKDMEEKEDLIKFTENFKNLEETEIKEKKFLGKLKRKYRFMIIFIIFLSLIVAFMILPMVIAVLLNP